MIVADKIKDIEKQIYSAKEKKGEYIKKLNDYISDREKAGDLCGKCDDGFVRKAFPIDTVGGSISIPEFLSRGYPTLCECVYEAHEYEKKIFEYEDEISSLNDKLSFWKRSRARFSDTIGSEYVDKGLYNFDRKGNEAAIDVLILWHKEGRKTPLMMIGRTGSGKTHILAGIINQFIVDRVDYHYIDGYRIDAMTLLEKHEFDYKLSRMVSADILIIDDIGKSKMTEALLNHVYFPLLNSRRNNKKITIYTSDKVPRKLWSTFPDRENVESLYTRIEWIENGSPAITIIPLKRGGENADKE